MEFSMIEGHNTPQDRRVKTAQVFITIERSMVSSGVMSPSIRWFADSESGFDQDQEPGWERADFNLGGNTATLRVRVTTEGFAAEAQVVRNGKVVAEMTAGSVCESKLFTYTV